MGYGFGVWLVYDRQHVATEHLGHFTVACFMEKEDAIMLHRDIVSIMGDSLTVSIDGRATTYPKAFYEGDMNDLASWGYNGELDPSTWDQLRDAAAKYQCSFSLYPHTSVAYSRRDDLVPIDTHATSFPCRVVVADINGEPSEWTEVKP
jgi:hypothetical protein